MAHLVLCPRDSDAQRGSAQSPHGVGWRGAEAACCRLGLCSIWCLRNLCLRPASAWRSRRRPHPGSPPESASPPGNSRLPPLPGLGPATTHIPTPRQPPSSALPISQGHVTWARASPLQASVSSSGNGGYWSFCSSPDPLRTTRQHAVAACLPSMQLCTGSCVPSPDVTWAPAGLCI